MKRIENKASSPDLPRKLTNYISSPKSYYMKGQIYYTPFMKQIDSPSHNFNLLQKMKANKTKENFAENDNNNASSFILNKETVLPSIKSNMNISSNKLKTINTNRNDYLPKIKKSPLKNEKIKNEIEEYIAHNKEKDNAFFREKFFYYVIVPGNNSSLIKDCFSHRSAWRESQNNSTLNYNFRWQQNICGIDFSSINKIPSIKKSVNHFEFHNQISNKLNLFLNMMRYCEENDLDLWKYIPFTVIVNYEGRDFECQMDSFSKIFNNIRDYIKVKGYFNERKYKKYSTVFNVGFKFENLGYKTDLYINKNYYDGKNIWLVKATDLNRGRCIKMAESIQGIHSIIKRFNEGIFREFKESEKEDAEERSKKEKKFNLESLSRKYKTGTILLQKYLEKPLLYWGRKFDIRLWVLITHKFELWVFKEGHLKTSSETYNISQLNSYIHLTNYSVQKYNENFGKFEYGNEASFKDFQSFLDQNYADKRIDFRKDLLKKMYDIIILSFKSVKDKINVNNRKNCFEIFGYDFIIDATFHVHLLEVNTNPGLEESSPLIKQLVPRMIDDSLRLTVDDMFNPKYQFEGDIGNRTYITPYPVEGYSESENLW